MTDKAKTLEERIKEIEIILKKYSFKASENATTALEVELLNISKELLAENKQLKEKLNITRKIINQIEDYKQLPVEDRLHLIKQKLGMEFTTEENKGKDSQDLLNGKLPKIGSSYRAKGIEMIWICCGVNQDVVRLEHEESTALVNIHDFWKGFEEIEERLPSGKLPEIGREYQHRNISHWVLKCWSNEGSCALFHNNFDRLDRDFVAVIDKEKYKTENHINGTHYSLKEFWEDFEEIEEQPNKE